MVKRANGVKARKKGLNKHQRAAFREGEEIAFAVLAISDYAEHFARICQPCDQVA